MTMLADHPETDRNSPRRLTGRGVLAWLLGFFAVVFLANAVFIYLAMTSWTGLEVESSYKAGQAYQGEIDAASRQAALGWNVELSVERGAPGEVSLRVAARDAGGAPLTGLAVSARLQRPTFRAQDITVSLVEGEIGVYAARVAGVAPGQWVVRLAAEGAGDAVFRSRNRVFLAE